MHGLEKFSLLKIFIKATPYFILPVLTFQGTEECAKLRRIQTPLAVAPEELGLVQVVPPVGGSPKRIRVADTQVVPLLYVCSSRNQDATLVRKALGAVRATIVLEHGSGLVDGHVWRFGKRDFMGINLKKKKMDRI